MSTSRTATCTSQFWKTLLAVVSLQLIEVSSSYRGLLQTEGSSVDAKAIAATSSGGLVLNGSYAFTTNSSSHASTISSTTSSGISYYLGPGTAALSPFARQASCIIVQFSSDTELVDSYLTTQTSLQNALTGISLNSSRAQPIAGTVSQGMRSGKFQAGVNSSESYAFIIYNSAEHNQSAIVSFLFQAYPEASQECQGSLAAAGPQVSTQSVSNTTNSPAYFEEDMLLLMKETRPVAILSNASCVAFQLLGQAKDVSYLDLTVYIDSVASAVAWISNGFPKPIPYLGRVCEQSFATKPNPSADAGGLVYRAGSTVISQQADTNASIAPTQACQVVVDGLDPAEQYVLWTINGERSVDGTASDAFVRYTARTTGSCADVDFSRGGSMYAGTGLNSSLVAATGAVSLPPAASPPAMQNAPPPPASPPPSSPSPQAQSPPPPVQAAANNVPAASSSPPPPSQGYYLIPANQQGGNGQNPDAKQQAKDAQQQAKDAQKQAQEAQKQAKQEAKPQEKPKKNDGPGGHGSGGGSDRRR